MTTNRKVRVRSRQTFWKLNEQKYKTYKGVRLIKRVTTHLDWQTEIYRRQKPENWDWSGTNL